MTVIEQINQRKNPELRVCWCVSQS